MRNYYKIVCDREREMSGAGLGYTEIYGDQPRFFWDWADAMERAADLNFGEACHDALSDYDVVERRAYDDGSFDDDDDEFAVRQLFPEMLRHA